MLVYLLVLVLGCVALYFGGDWLIRGMQGLGAKLNLPPAAVGLLLVSLGTSAPELFVSAGAALQGYGGIAAGNAIGSNVVNTLIVLGIGAVIVALPVQRIIVRRQIPVMCAITVLAVLLLLDQTVSRLDGVLLLAACAGGLWWATRGPDALASGGGDGIAGSLVGADAVDEEIPDTLATSALWSGLGIAALIAGAEALIWSGTNIATLFGVSEAVIALTVTSIGTSLPEIAATIVAVMKREVDLAIGNVVGSNIMNLGLVLGAAGVLTPIDGSGLGTFTYAFLLGSAFLLAALAWGLGRISRPVGAALLVGYGVYVTGLLS